MSRKLSLAALVAIALLGSLFAVLGANMFFSDIGNMSAVGPKGHSNSTEAEYIQLEGSLFYALDYPKRRYRNTIC